MDPVDRVPAAGQAQDDLLLALGSLTRMVRLPVVALTALLAAVACGGSTPTAPSGPTASTVAVQQSDLPAGMVRCDLSGDIDSFIQKEQSPDPATAKSMASEWDQAKKNGATAGHT